MDIIPVIDLMQNQVVRAKKGERHLYRPIESGLCSGSAPLEIVSALLELYPFKTLYIADLDAIQDRGDHRSSIAAIRRQFPDLELWLDAGIHRAGQCSQWEELAPRLVIGSEKISTLPQLQQILQSAETAILSLDFSANGFLGPAALLDTPGCWTQTAIAMTLGRVGSLQGPDLDTFSALKGRAPSTALYAAGGVRDTQDLQQLAARGAAGALVASVLHDGRVTTQQLQDMARR